MSSAFTPVDLDGRGTYLEKFALSPQKASDYSFINIWAWRDVYGLQWCFKDNLAWIRQTIPETVYWAPVGDWEGVSWSSCSFMAEKHTFIRVPEVLTGIWRQAFPERLNDEEDRGHWDYLYNVQDLVTLSGNRFHKKKNLYNQFVKNYEYSYDPITADCVEEALDLQDSWCEWRDCESSETLVNENEAVFRTLTNWDQLPEALGGALRVDGKIVAFTVGEALSDDTLVVHFEKGHGKYKGVYQAINREFLASESVSSFRLVNREQDLGDEGLRKAKESYHPVDYLKKSTVTLS